MEDIHFGTDGWRAIIGEGFTDDNVVRVVDAAARVFKEEAASAGRPADAPGTLIVGQTAGRMRMPTPSWPPRWPRPMASASS